MNSSPLVPGALLALSLAWCAEAADWPQRRGLNNDGKSAETAWSHEWPDAGPKSLWQAQAGTGFSGVVVSGGTAITVGHADGLDSVRAYDAATGKVRWTFEYPEALLPKMYEGGPNSTPSIVGTNVYTLGKSGKAFRLDLATGRAIWTNDLTAALGPVKSDWGVAGSPLVDSGRVYVNYGSAAVALDADTGKLLWKSAEQDKGVYSFTTPVLAKSEGRDVLLVHMHKSLMALTPADGRELWRSAFGRGYETHSSDPVLTPAGVFISSGDDGGELLRWTAGSAARVWKNKNLSTFTGTAIEHEGHLYGVESGGYRKGEQEFRCVDLQTGSIRWSLRDFGQDSWIWTPGRLIVLRDSGELVVLKATPEAGEILARHHIMGGKCWTQPTLADGRLFCRNAAGLIRCYDLSGSVK
jgi:outer membrane protein assembly factor BamB